MIPTTLHPRNLAMLPLLTVAAFAWQTASAETYNQSFFTPLGGLPTGWNVTWAGTATTGPENGTASIVEAGGGNVHAGLRQTRDNNAPGNSIIRYNGSEGPFESGVISDFTAVSTFYAHSSSLNYSFGLVVRAQSTTDINTFNGYYVTFVGQNNSFGIYRNVVTNTDLGTQLATQSVSGGLNNTDLYRISTTLVGSSITAEFHRWNTVTETWTSLASIGATDATYASGGFGFRNGMQGSTRGVYWQDLQVTSVIPEPGQVALVLGALVLALAVWRRRSQAAA